MGFLWSEIRADHHCVSGRPARCNGDRIRLDRHRSRRGDHSDHNREWDEAEDDVHVNAWRSRCSGAVALLVGALWRLSRRLIDAA
jgi:hypothetical protein